MPQLLNPSQLTPGTCVYRPCKLSGPNTVVYNAVGVGIVLGLNHGGPRIVVAEYGIRGNGFFPGSFWAIELTGELIWYRSAAAIVSKNLKTVFYRNKVYHTQAMPGAEPYAYIYKEEVCRNQ